MGVGTAPPCADDKIALCRVEPGDGRPATEPRMTAIAYPPPGTRSRMVEGMNGLTMHVLEAGFEDRDRPCVLLLHGFPELAYSWRKVMPAIAAAGFHVVAPDQRGYGRTTGWDGGYDGDLDSYRLSTWCATPWGSSRRWAAARWRRSSAPTSAPRSPPAAPASGRTG